jgi:hypothetical protein
VPLLYLYFDSGATTIGYDRSSVVGGSLSYRNRSVRSAKGCRDTYFTIATYEMFVKIVKTPALRLLTHMPKAVRLTPLSDPAAFTTTPITHISWPSPAEFAIPSLLRTRFGLRFRLPARAVGRTCLAGLNRHWVEEGTCRAGPLGLFDYRGRRD